ncbi:MAG: entericidin A/B family lipoprotein [Phycisphaeraceae bacterium]
MSLYHLVKRFGRHGLLSVALMAALGIAGASLTGCNTVEGAGEDVEAVGEGVQDVAD